MLTQRRLLLAALSVFAVLGSAIAANATSVSAIAYPFTGADTSVRITLTEDAGDIVVSLRVREGLADLRGFFLNIGDNSLLEGLEVTGDDVTGFEFDTETASLINLKKGNNLNGGGSPCPCDIAIAIGTPGTGKDDILSTTFTLDADHDLALTDFANELAGVRVTSVSSFDDKDKDPKKGDRGGSAKLFATIPDPGKPVPEPSTGFLLGLGLFAFAARRRRASASPPGLVRAAVRRPSRASGRSRTTRRRSRSRRPRPPSRRAWRSGRARRTPRTP